MFAELLVSTSDSRGRGAACELLQAGEWVFGSGRLNLSVRPNHGVVVVLSHALAGLFAVCHVNRTGHSQRGLPPSDASRVDEAFELLEEAIRTHRVPSWEFSATVIGAPSAVRAMVYVQLARLGIRLGREAWCAAEEIEHGALYRVCVEHGAVSVEQA